MDMTKAVTRLFNQFVPENYDLKIIPDVTSMHFSGSVTIKGKKTGRPSKRITLHQNGLNISKAKIIKHDKSGASEINISRINTHKTFDEVRLHSEEIMYPGLYTITLDFDAKITKPMNGLYPCYFKKDGSEKIILATQFESHHAREVFPCIDEPEAKATFNLTLTTPKENITLANTPVLSEEVNGNVKTTVFESSPIMSSYLLAFVSGDLHCVEAKTKHGISMRTWGSTAQPLEFMEYANKEAIDLLEFYEDYFGTPFPLKKCDQVALPDFESGAMENWGLVTYREVALLTDPKNRSLSSEQYVSMVVAHELSHQWFGNLVTMKWWDDLWLNESFASMMEHLALNILHPEWKQWEQYVSSDIIACSNRDIYTSVQPVKVPVRHPDEIHSLFDPAIVYAKGGRLLKMMLDYIGEEAFRTGLKNYFAKHAYKNTIRDDLWTEMSASSGKDVNALMDPWLEQSGMPVIKVTPKSTNTRVLEQSRFALDSDSDSSLWPVPLLASKPFSTDLLIGKSTEVTFSDKLPIINSHGSGHYVTHYTSDDDLTLIIKDITSGNLGSEARINILNDMMLLARRGDDSLVDALKLIRHLKNEPREPVWMMMARAIGLAGNIGEGDEEIETGLKKLRYEIAHEQYSKLGWEDNEDDDPNTKLLRATIIGIMLGAENKAVIDHAVNIFRTTKDIEDIPSDRRGAVLGSVVRHGNKPDEINTLLELYKETSNADLQSSVSSALTYTKDADVAQRLIDEGLGENGFIRSQDSFRWFAYLMRNKYTRDQAWGWLTNNWDYVSEKIGKKSLDHWVVYSAGPLQTNEWEAKFHEFYEPKKEILTITRNIEIAYAEISARVAWRNRELHVLKDFLKSLR